MPMPRILFYIIPWFGYPIALYRIATFQKAIDETTRLRRSLEKMEKDVENGLVIKNTSCLEDDTWKHVIWNGVSQ
ncbi:hypothetical protein EDB82DRAFT_494128 [Fusarium venenatum]|uniref:uncharacterized protein n=1 Tax=Fusarium venenatum TaxID=56646 RepID=UPI001DEBB0B5|nr:hypothetical protein EDB82DRAFT_494128 [Fusarium venenatum]